MSKKEDEKKFNKDGKFDQKAFNASFEEQIKTSTSSVIKTENEIKKMLISDLKIGQILTNMKNSVFEIIEEILEGKIGFSLITKKDRLFYIGSMFLFIALAMCIIDFIIGPSHQSLTPSLNSGKPIYQMHHIHHIVGNADNLGPKPIVESTLIPEEKITEPSVTKVFKSLFSKKPTETNPITETKPNSNLTNSNVTKLNTSSTKPINTTSNITK